MSNKIFKSIIALILVASLLSICVYANDILFADEFIIEETYVAEDGTVMPMANCGNHVWYVANSGAYAHLLRCSNPGCGGAMNENHYNNSFCGQHPNENTIACQVCEYANAVSIHNFNYVHEQEMSDYTHIYKCTNIDEYGYGECEAVRAYGNCTLTSTIWRSFKIGYGHMYGDLCSLCGELYDVEYYMPTIFLHANGYDSRCEYCNMDTETGPFYN